MSVHMSSITLLHAAPVSLYLSLYTRPYSHLPLYSYTADIYSLSLIAWELYTGQCPFDQMHVSQIVAAVAVRGERPPIGPGVSAEQARLLQRYVHAVYMLYNML